MKFRHFILVSFCSLAWSNATFASDGADKNSDASIFQKLTDTLDFIFAEGLPPEARRSFARLRFLSILEPKQARHAHAFYVETKDAIAVNPSLGKRSAVEVQSILAHELGHALVFSRLSPLNLQTLAQELAGWKINGEMESHYATPLLTKFSGQVQDNKLFPTVYAFANTHEWFAENFAQFIMNRLGHKASIDNKMNAYFLSLLTCQDKAASARPCLEHANLVYKPSPVRDLGLIESHYALNTSVEL